MGEQLIKCYAISLPNESYNHNKDNLYMNGKYIMNEHKTDDFSYSSSYREPIQIYAVSDGIGDGEKGSVPSTAVMQILKVLQKRLNEERNLSIPKARKMIRDFIIDTNNKICLYKNQFENENESIGTTFAAIFLFGNKAFTVHVGDSRVYLFKNNRLLQITQDHLECYSLVKLGILSDEQAEVHKIRSKVTKYFGFDDEEQNLSASFSEVFNVYPGDIIFLTTDGVTDRLGNDEMKAIIEKNNKDEVILGKEIMSQVSKKDSDCSLVMLNIDEVVRETIIRDKDILGSSTPLTLPKINIKPEDKKRYAIFGVSAAAILIVMLVILLTVGKLIGDDKEPVASPPVVENEITQDDSTLDASNPNEEAEQVTETPEGTITEPNDVEQEEAITETGVEEVADSTIPTHYEVQAGDNLYQISMTFYNDPTIVQKIAYINNIPDPRSIEVGQKLLLPHNDGSIEYKVQPGDTIYSISMKFFGTKSKEEDIMKRNNITDVNNLVAGITIIIP